MATIITRRLKDGSRSYRATVTVKRQGVIVHKESKSFRALELAREWSREREYLLKNGRDLPRPAASGAATDVASLIDRYMDEFKELQQWSRTKEHHLKLLRRLVGHWDASTLTTAQVVEHVRERRVSGTGPSTVNNDLIWLRTVLKTARSAWGMSVNVQAVDDAGHASRQLKLTAKSRQRDRRPSQQELDALRRWFARDDGRREIPMHELIDFAVASARREDEICQLLWNDIDRRTMTATVRDMKDPERTKGNDVVVKLTQESLAVIDRQQKLGERVFPYNAKSVSSAFTRACAVLGIKDLRFHDLRHEATCRLFERGYQIHEVAHFTAHRSWSTLKRYAQLRAADLNLK